MRRNTFISSTICFLLCLILITSSCKKEDHLISGLEKFSLVCPGNMDTNQNVRVYLSWTGLSETNVQLPFNNVSVGINIAYEVLVWEKETHEIEYHENLHNYFTYTDSLKNSTLYQWKVIVYLNDEVLSESEVREFRTEPKYYDGNIVFSTQYAVDTFGSKYYEVINGDLKINSSSEDPITDLSPFSTLKRIKGSLLILDCMSITCVDSFTLLTQIDGGLSICRNQNLVRIKGFDSLKKTNYICITENTSLLSLESFQNVDSIGGDIIIEYNKSLASISSFEKTRYTGSITIFDNPSLLTIDGFNVLDSIGNGLEIWLNNNLVSVSGFNNLLSVGFGKSATQRDIIIEFNKNLEDIGGFKKLKQVYGSFSINMNKITNINGFENLNYIGKSMSLASDTIQSIDGFNNLEIIGGSLFLGGSNVKSIHGFSKLDSIGQNFMLNYLDELDLIDGFNSLRVINGSFSISLNTNITALDGFNNIQSVGSLTIENNYYLNSLNGFNALHSIGSELRIALNDNISEINGFKMLSSVKSSFYIVGNENLSGFCGFKSLVLANGIKGSVEIRDNLVNPTLDDIHNMVCE